MRDDENYDHDWEDEQCVDKHPEAVSHVGLFDFGCGYGFACSVDCVIFYFDEAFALPKVVEPDQECQCDQANGSQIEIAHIAPLHQ